MVWLGLEFDAKSKELSCGSEGPKVLVEGALAFSATESGNTLSVYGAPTGPLPPAVFTGGSSEVTTTTAKLAGTVASRGVATTYQFEYGTNTSYGSKVPASPASAGEGRNRVEYTQTATGLEPGVLYHYRISATDSGGTTHGEDKTFTAGYPAKWQINGAAPKEKPIKAEGTVDFYGPYEAKFECTIAATGTAGWIGINSLSKISTVTGSKGESLVACHKVKAGLLCSAPEVEATNLPWTAELVEEPIKNEKGEVVRYEARDKFYEGSGGKPGWVVKCGSSFKEACVGEFSGNLENASGGVVGLEFDVKSKELSCGSEGPKVLVEGALAFSATESGNTLSVYGAPTGPLPPAVFTGGSSEVTTTTAKLAGTVASRGVATTYQFEYGTNTSYGSKVPASPASAGEGRNRVEYTQTATGLEPGVLYHYRISATDSGGTTHGEDKTFTAGYPAKWQINGAAPKEKPIKAEGQLIVADPGLGTVECTVDETGTAGWIGINSLSKISTVTGSKGETQLSCRTIKQSWCGETPITVEPINLPWTAELVEEPIKNEKGEVVRYEARNRFSEGSGGKPGWVLKCAFLGSTATDVCAGEPSGNTENVTAGVPDEFDRKSLLTCSGSIEKTTTTMEGVLLTTATEGTLSVYGAPTGPLPPDVATREASGVTNSGATLNGTIGAKALKTEYHFEYGTSISYGTSVPVPEGKAGEGRTRVEVSEAVTGLQASTLYYYRLVAKNSAGTSYGEDETFTTK